MQRQIIYYLLILFAIFLIANDASGSGDVANSFFDWLGDGLGKTRTFINSTLGEDTAATP